MASESGKRAGETLQIVILTFFMTAGFFALFTVVLAFMLPSKERAVARQVDDLKNLRLKLKRNGELWKLRDQVKILEAQSQGEGSLRAIVGEELASLDITSKSLPSTDTRKMSQRGGSTVEHSQTVDYVKVETQTLFNFVARVKTRRRGIYLASMSMSRDRGASAEDPTWSGKLVFKLYENPDVTREFEKRRAAAAKRRAAEEGGKATARPAES